MCNFVNKANVSKANGRNTAEVYPKQSQNLPYESVKPFHCAWTKEPLTPEYVLQTGLTPKAFSEEIYQNIINNKRPNCFLCGEGLSQQKQSAQHSQHREISNHMCPECEEYMGLIYRKVAGQDNSFLLDEQRVSRPALPPPTAEHNEDPDVIDAEFREVTPQALPGGAYPAIGYQPMQSLDDMFSQTPQKQMVPVPVGKLH
ncbi:hypothetical protein D1BOALGB6SA_5973 [Olavius sp. associated proteobacterium Delta 1]|nr:hypothetical protein D1BOALGB6SA_5973 [Olavius sp. associated proteobacterium Delta 1]